MANGASNIGLRPTQAVTTDFGNIMNQGLDRLAQNEEKARLEQERQDQKNKEFEDRYGIDESLYTIEDTEFRTVNDATTEALAMFRDRNYEIFKQLKENPNDIDLKKRLGSITNSVKRMRASHDKIKQVGEEYLARLEADQLSGVDEEAWRERLEATDEGRIKINADENDNLQILFYGKNGKLEDVLPYKDLIQGSLIDKVDLDTELDGLVKRIGTDKIDVVSGGFIKSLNQFGPDQSRFVREWIDSYLGTDEKSLETNPVLADLLNQATGGSSKKRSNFTEQDRQQVRDYLIQQTKDRFNEEISLKQLSVPSQSRPTAAELKQPKPSDINLSFDGGVPQLDAQGRFVFTIAKDIPIDPTKSDRKIDAIHAAPDGSLSVAGEDRIKIKGVQEDDTVESVAEREGVEPSMVEQLLGDDGSVQYFKRVPFSTDDMSADQKTKVINKVGNIFGVEDELGLRNVLYQDMIAKYGQETADSVINAAKAPKQAAPKQQTKIDSLVEPESKFSQMNAKELLKVDAKSLPAADKMSYYKALAATKREGFID